MIQRSSRQKIQGFTLLEVMVVLAIITLMATLVVPNLMGNSRKADLKKAKIDISTLESAVQMYKLDNHSYPTTEQGLAALVHKPQLDPVPQSYSEGGYIMRLPTDPWGNDYQYRRPGEHHNAFDVFSKGPDGQSDTPDDIGNWTNQ